MLIKVLLIALFTGTIIFVSMRDDISSNKRGTIVSILFVISVPFIDYKGIN